MDHFSVKNVKKTYGDRKTKQLTKKISRPKSDVEKVEPLTTKVAIQFLLGGKLQSKVCRYCLNITPGLSELDQIMKIGGSGSLYKVTIRDIVASFHPFKVADDPNFPNKICQKCLDKALGAYLFTQQCERAERAMLNCFEDMYEKLEKLDAIDKPKKRGRQKLNPNYNTLYAEHNEVIDYAEPIINIVNVGAEMVTVEPELHDFECKKCWQVLPNLESLLNHEKIHPKTMWFHCRLCGKSFPKLNLLKRHNNRAHILGKELIVPLENNFKCDECGHNTDNFIQHLQHVEKHKFKKVMKHLIEKRMDKLCVVCFNEGSIMNDLDKIVCIHGCHPDLMGDKTLYTLLADTLPNPNSYKYQELFIPSKASVMTITKRHLKLTTENIKVWSKHFELSHPIIIKTGHYKTDHFYCYVFTEPELNKDVDLVCDTNCIETEDIQQLQATNKIVEITEIHDVKDDLNNEIEKSDNNIGMGTKSHEINEQQKLTVTENQYCTFNFSIPELIAFDAKDMNIDDSGLHTEFKFSDPEVINDDKNTKSKELEVQSCPEYVFANPKYDIDEVSNEFRANTCLETGTKESYVKNATNRCWIFKNTYNSQMQTINNASIGETDTQCKFCWIFKVTGTCDHCKKPIKDIKSTADVKNKDKYRECLKEKSDMKWQCSICLTKNDTDRVTCHCCGNAIISENSDIKITFGSNKTYFDIEKKKEFCQLTKDGTYSNNQEEINSYKSIILDCKTHCVGNIDAIFFDDNKQEMDVEMDTPLNVTTSENVVEDMDVEECPIVSKDTDWNECHFKWNMDNMTIPVSTEVKPMISSNLQFYIGTAEHKPNRKLKRAFRKYNR